jgi:hypothetical protein
MSTFNPRDLHISIRAATSSNRIYNGGPKGSIYPGWFLEVFENEGYDRLVSKQLSIEEVREIALKIEFVLSDSPLIVSAVNRCESAMREDLRRQLDVAKQQAARIPELKKMLGEQ